MVYLTPLAILKLTAANVVKLVASTASELLALKVPLGLGAAMWGLYWYRRERKQFALTSYWNPPQLGCELECS